MTYHSVIVGVTGAALLGMFGCGGNPGTAPTAKVTGTVTYKGQPAQGASVAFIPQGGQGSQGGRPASGTTDASGKFTLSTFAPSDGAIPGKHQVMITEDSDSSQPPLMPGMPGYKEKKSRFPVKYGSVRTTPLKAEVKTGGPNDFTFEMAD